MSSGLDENQLSDYENEGEKLEYIKGGYLNLERSILDENCIARLFLSGGGLRVVRVERNNKQKDLIYYGEHINFFPAMENVEQDCINNGKNAKGYLTEYYTGSRMSDSNIDLWLSLGGKIFFHNEFGEIVAEARYYDGRVIFRYQDSSLKNSITGLEEIMDQYNLLQLSSGLVQGSITIGANPTEEQLLLARKPSNSDLPF